MKHHLNQNPITRFDATDRAPQRIALPHGEAICFSDRSPIKDTPNEDALAIIPLDDEATVLIVADGVGGMPAGEQASQILIEAIMAELTHTEQRVRDAILNGIDAANKKILDLKTGAGATVSIAEIISHKLRTYHAGDSLILLMTDHGNIKYRTISHSPIGYAVACGAIGREQAMLHPERNLISNYVGCDDMYLTIGPSIELTPLDTLVLSSDGLADNLYENEICAFLRKAPMADGISNMIEQCKHNMLETLPDRLCHPDDLTLIGFRQNN